MNLISFSSIVSHHSIITLTLIDFVFICSISIFIYLLTITIFVFDDDDTDNAPSLSNDVHYASHENGNITTRKTFLIF